MKRSWGDLPFFWKVYAGAVTLICVVVLLAEFAEDFIPYMVNERAENMVLLQDWLDRYEKADPAGRRELRRAMREAGVWFVDVPPEARGGLIDEEANSPAVLSGVLQILPESDDWEHDWTILDRLLDNGHLLAAGLPEPAYFDALEGVMWFVVIVLFAGVCCYFFCLAITSRLSRVVGAAEKISKGDLKARVPAPDSGGDEIVRLARSFNGMAKSIESVVENERRLLYDISHELRSPLARMRLALDLLRRSPGATWQAEAAEYFTLLESDLERMSEMMEGLMEQGRSQSVLLELAEELDMHEVLRNVVDMANFEFEGGRSKVGCSLSWEPKTPARLRGAHLLLEQAFYNVLDNGSRYAPAGSLVEVSAELRPLQAELPADSDQPDATEAAPPAQELLVSIRDFGPGVPEESLEKLFKPFYRVESARDKASGGVGLGLALSRNYLRRHGGSIYAENANPGLRVVIVLPLNA